MNIAILGAGNMGTGHAKRLIALGETVVAVCDKNQNATTTFLKEIAPYEPKTYHSFDQMLTDSDFDAVFICLPPFAQDGQFEKAANAGKHIFIEKPIALTTEIGKSMVQAAQRNNIITQVGFHQRKGSGVKHLKELISTGKAGRPVLFNGQYECNSLHTPWWINVNLCGGQIFEQAIHVYDMCRYLMGNPKGVMGLMDNLCHNDNPAYTVEDVSASIAKLTSGAVASITATNCAVPDKWIGKFTAVFENYTMFFETSTKACLVNTKTGETLLIDEENDQMSEEIIEFLTAIKERKQSSCGVEEGYLSLCYVAAAVASATLDGQKVSVKNLYE